MRREKLLDGMVYLVHREKVLSRETSRPNLVWAWQKLMADCTVQLNNFGVWDSLIPFSIKASEVVMVQVRSYLFHPLPLQESLVAHELADVFAPSQQLLDQMDEPGILL